MPKLRFEIVFDYKTDEAEFTPKTKRILDELGDGLLKCDVLQSIAELIEETYNDARENWSNPDSMR